MKARILGIQQELIQSRKRPGTAWSLTVHFLKAQNIGPYPPQLRPHDLDAVSQGRLDIGAIV
jgi:hypothetical protein